MASFPLGVSIANLFAGGWCGGGGGGGGSGDGGKGFTFGFVYAGATVEVASTMSAT